jgi:type II secretory ATPase GspE/PulE/Tfp pilus assembly ATPase PilB-like protein/8-oxo-dGTP pyrophosphatase MutT (NUDIX family)
MTKPHPIHDDWILPILQELVSTEVFNTFTRERDSDYWNSAVQTGITTDAQLLDAIARRTHIAIASVPLSATEQAKYYIPELVARRYTIVPLTVSQSILTVATANPYDLDCEQALGFISGKRIEFRLASPRQITEYLDTLYQPAQSHVSKLLEEVRSSYAPSQSLQPGTEELLSARGYTTQNGTRALERRDEGTTEIASTSRPIIQLVDHIVADGISKRASDIHLEAEESAIAVRYRIDGVLQHAITLPREVGLPLVSRIKIMARMDIADRLRPQGGRIRVTINDQAVDLRVSTLPATHGEKVVIRILDSRAALRSLDSLGLPPAIATRLRKLLDIREGLILITGPTGSGKTTTLYAALQELLQRGLNIITVEDPVEYRVPGIVQVQVNDKAGLTFAAALRSILRQDPDVVLIGEVRDRETAAIAIQAALTGHLVFATLHTIDACSSITRLQDLGVDPAKVAAALKGVIAQRLVRRLCTDCARPSSDPIPPLLWNAIPTGATLLKPTGCTTCGQTGYRGRIAVPELVPITPDLERLIASAATTPTLIAAARSNGAQSLWESGVSYVLDGITSAEEIARVLDAEHQEPLYDSTYLYGQDDPSSIFDQGEGEEQNVPTEPSIDVVPQPRHLAPPVTPMTKLEIGVVDVYIVDPNQSPWRVLALKRASDTVRPNSWETVHGKIDANETPEQAAVREVKEETGLTVQRLYNVTVHAFYLRPPQTVQLAIVFCAFVDSAAPITLSGEHQQYEWLPITAAGDHFTWPRARQALIEIAKLLNPDTLPTVEDVLRAL